MSFDMTSTFNILISDFNINFYSNSLWIQINSNKFWKCNIIVHIYFSHLNLTIVLFQVDLKNIFWIFFEHNQNYKQFLSEKLLLTKTTYLTKNIYDD